MTLKSWISSVAPRLFLILTSWYVRPNPEGRKIKINIGPKNNSENCLPTSQILDLLIKSIFNEMDIGLIQLLKSNDNLRNQKVKQGDKGSVVKTQFTIFMIYNGMLRHSLATLEG